MGCGISSGKSKWLIGCGEAHESAEFLEQFLKKLMNQSNLQQVSMDKWTKKKHGEYDPGTLHHRMPKTKKELKN